MSALSYRCFACDKADALHVVLIHGWGLHGGVWDKVIEPLRTFAHVTVIDRAGYGNSPRMTKEQELAALLAIMPPEAVYVGWSLGFTLVAEVAARYPARVHGVVAVAANPCFVWRPEWVYGLAELQFRRVVGRTLSNPDAELVRFIGLQCHDSPSQREDMLFLKQQLAAKPMPYYRVLIEGLTVLSDDQRPTVEKITCPILWLLGERDSLVKLNHEVLAALNKKIIVSIVKDAAHVPFVSHAAVFITRLANFCRELQYDSF